MSRFLTYSLAIIMAPIFLPAFLLFWFFFAAWTHKNTLILENDTQVDVGGWRWWWYRIMLGYRTAKRCPDCHKIIDSVHTTNLCECAHDIDMKGMV